MRKIFDPVNPPDLHSAVTSIQRQLQRQKILKSYQYLGGYIVSIDGTGPFSSSQISCQDCGRNKGRNNNKQFYHQLLGAVIVPSDKSSVLPGFPEAITSQDGKSTNDCERNASKRLLPARREAFPKLKLIVVEDALASNAPPIRLLEEWSVGYILVAKPSDHADRFLTRLMRFAISLHPTHTD